MRQELKDKLEADIKTVKRVFATEDGKRLLRILEEISGQQLFDPDPYRTAYRLGSHDLIQYIRRVNELERRPS